MLTCDHYIVIYVSRRWKPTPHLPHSSKYQGNYAFKPWEYREPLPGHCCTRALSQDIDPLKLPYFLAHISDRDVLEHYESALHKLRITNGLILVTPSFHGWETFPTLEALTYIRITWALSLMAPQVSGVTPGSLLCPWCFGHSSWKGAR